MDADAYAIAKQHVIDYDKKSDEDPFDYFERKLRQCLAIVPRDDVAIFNWMSIIGVNHQKRSIELRTETLRRALDMVNDPLFGCNSGRDDARFLQGDLDAKKRGFLHAAIKQALPTSNMAPLLRDDAYYARLREAVACIDLGIPGAASILLKQMRKIRSAHKK